MASFRPSASLLFLLHSGTLHLDGHVVRARPGSLQPMAHLTVRLHRVAERGEVVDSAQSDATGRFRFVRATPTGDSAVYFATVTYDGITYLSSFRRAGEHAAGPADVMVYDTTSAPVPVRIAGRHLIVTATTATVPRSILEVYDLAVDTALARVPRGSADDGAVWSAPLPSSAQAPRVSEGTIAAEEVVFRGGRALVFTPLSPAGRQLSVAYAISPANTRLAFPVEQAADAVELLVEEAGARVSGGGLAEAEPVTIDGRAFRRFTAQHVPRGTTLVVEVPGFSAGVSDRYLAVLIGTVGVGMLAALAFAYRRR